MDISRFYLEQLIASVIFHVLRVTNFLIFLFGTCFAFKITYALTKNDNSSLQMGNMR